MNMVEQAIGDLSSADRRYLAQEAGKHSRILEGGAGASTQILAHYSASGRIVSYDTDPKWIERVRDVLFPKLGVDGFCEFREYTTEQIVEGRYDFVFVDLEWRHRFSFATEAWYRLVPGGKLVFHDARRDKDMGLIYAFLKDNYREIDTLTICPDATNMAEFTKRSQRCDYVNWHKTEGWTREQLGVDWL